jgi:hypothetical protein
MDTLTFTPTWAAAQAALDDAHLRWDHLAVPDPEALPFEALLRVHAEIAAVAHDISGTTRDNMRRAILYFALFEDSERNLMFPLVASHGSMWGIDHTDRIEVWLERLSPLSRHGRIDRWLEAIDQVRDVNRRVFREIYTTFYFTRFYGQHPEAGRIIKPEILALYNRVHEAVRTKVPLDLRARQTVYFGIFVHEQDDIVDPGLVEAAAKAGPFLVEALKRVSPRFAYFPRRERLWFSDFTDVEQRNQQGLRALAFAEEVGPERIFAALADY